MGRRLRYAVMIICILAISSAAIAGFDETKPTKARSKEDLYSQVELLADAISIVRSDFVDETNSKKLIYGAMRGLLGSLDDHSQFLEPGEYKEMKTEAKGEFGGVGIELTMREGILTVISPIAGTPAEAAGVKAGDRLVKIDGRITRDMTLDDSIDLLRGDPGTSVTLTVWREKEGDGKIIDVPIKRAAIKINSIKKAVLLEGGIGYVKLVEFQENTGRDLESALKKLEKERMDALILDMRNNPGGILDSAVDVAERFLSKDAVIVLTKSRIPDQNMVCRSKGRFPHPSYPIIVMVNEGSASASEIVAGAIQDNKRGMVLGTKTFGKASVQTVVPLKDGSALRLTTASYFTPSGRMIRDHGIVPDIVVERQYRDGVGVKDDKKDIFEKMEKGGVTLPEEVPDKEKVSRDNQLESAVNLIKALKVYKTIDAQDKSQETDKK